MKLLSFEAPAAGTPGPRAIHVGALRDDGSVVDLTATGDPAFGSMLGLIEAGPAALDRARTTVDAAAGGIDPTSIVWRAPLPVPAQMRDFLVFEEHMQVAGFQAAKVRAKFLGGPPPPPAPMPIPKIWFDQPIYYKGNRFAVSGPGARVKWPGYSRIIDYELEIGCIIGRGGVDISVDDAPRHIFGYTIFNDLTARDAQFKETQGPLGPAKGKDFDQANVLGPVIVTADAIDIGSVAMRAFVNDELRCDGNSATMHWSFAQMIAHVSQGETLHPGEVLGSGTVGKGCGLELGRFLKDGDRVRLEIDGIGALEVTIDAPHVPDELTV